MKIEQDISKIDVRSVISPIRIELNKKLCSELANVLNSVHGTNLSLRFWKLMLGDHVNAVISQKLLLEKKDIFRKPLLTPINSQSAPTLKQIFKRELIRTIKYFRRRKNKSRYYSTLRNHDNILVGFPESKALNSERLGIKLPEFDKLFLGRGDKNKRKHINKIALSYEDTYMANVIRMLPKILIEHFKSTYDSIDLYSPDKKAIHLHLGGSIYTQFMTAKYVEHGAKLYWYQHGSSYGEYEFYNGHLISNELADEFRTWGWKIKRNDVPWKAYRLEAFAEKYRKLPTVKEYDLLLCFPQLNQKKREYYANFIQNFLERLREDEFKRIVARPRRSNKIHSHASELAFIDDSRVEVSSGLQPMMEAMSKTKLMLQIEVPSTNFLECIYVDQPVMGMLKNDQPTSIIEPYYRFFLEKGVLHRDLDSLCDHLNNVDLKQWWEDLTKNPTYQSFKHTFTRKV